MITEYKIKGSPVPVNDYATRLIPVFAGREKAIKIPAGEFKIDNDIVVCSNDDVSYTLPLEDLNGNDLGTTHTITKPGNVPFAFKKGVTYILTADFVGERM